MDAIKGKLHKHPKYVDKTIHMTIENRYVQKNNTDCGAFVLAWATNQLGRTHMALTTDTTEIRKRVFNHIVNTKRIHIPPRDLRRLIKKSDCGICKECPCRQEVEGPELISLE